MAYTNPTVTEREGDIFYYPLYEPTWLQDNYVLGTFMWVYVYSWMAIAYLNKEFDKGYYKFINGSSMWAYISHYVWIVIICELFIRHNLKLGMAAGSVVNFVFSVGLILGSYYLIHRFCPKKKKRTYD